MMVSGNKPFEFLSLLCTFCICCLRPVQGGRALPSEGTRGGASNTVETITSESSVIGTTGRSTAGYSFFSTALDAFRRLGKDEDDEMADDMGDDCWGWEDDWTDDEYEKCWDGTFQYVLNPDRPPERCQKYDPGDNTDDWTGVCAEWHASYGVCASDGEYAEECKAGDTPFAICCIGHICADDKSGLCVPYCGEESMKAKACGSNKDDNPLECCEGMKCGEDKACVALPTCATFGDQAVGCGATEGLFATECCDGLICSSTGGESSCVVPPPPVDCIDSSGVVIIETSSGIQNTVTCGDVTFGDQCDAIIAGDADYRVASYCRVTCMDDCALTETPTSAPSPNPTASPTRQPTAAPQALKQYLISFHPYAIEFIVPTEGSNRRRSLQIPERVVMDEDELEKITTARISLALSPLSGDFKDASVYMEKVGETSKTDFVGLLYSLNGFARFEGYAFDSLPSQSEVDASVLSAIADNVYLKSLRASSYSTIASIISVDVNEMDEAPRSPSVYANEMDESPSTPSIRAPKDGSDASSSPFPVGVVAGVAGAICALILIFAVGVYRSKKRNAKKGKEEASTPLSNQSEFFGGGFDATRIHEETNNSSGIGNTSKVEGQNHQSETTSSFKDTEGEGQETQPFDDVSQMTDSMMGDVSVTFTIDQSGDESSAAVGVDDLRNADSTTAGSVADESFDKLWKDDQERVVSASDPAPELPTILDTSIDHSYSSSQNGAIII